MNKNILLFALVLTLFGACTYKNVADAEYPESLIYLPTAIKGVVNINSVTTANPAPYIFDAPTKKFSVALGVVRSGLDNAGSSNVDIKINSDTITKMLAAGTLVNAELLPSDKASVPTNVNIESGKDSAPFSLTVDSDFLLANPTKKYATAVTISSAQGKVNQGLKTVIVVIDASIFTPIPDFTFEPDPNAPKVITFTNKSKNALSYSWDFGDGSAVSTVTSPGYTYKTPGTYLVKLTATGLTGIKDAKVKMDTVVIK
jgi:hypothetical protein